MKKNALTIVLAILAIAAIVFAVTTNSSNQNLRNEKTELESKLTKAVEDSEAALNTAKEEAAAELAATKEAAEAELAAAKEEAAAELVAAKEAAAAELAAAKDEAEATINELKAQLEEAVKPAEEAVENVVETVEDAVEAAPEAVEEAVEGAAETAAEVVENVTDTVKETAEAAQEAAENAAETVEGAVEETADAVAEVAENAADAVEGAVEEVTDAVAEVAVMSHEEYVAAALDTEVKVETYVQAKQSWWDNKATIYAQSPDGAYFIYNMGISQEDYEKLVPGTKIIVTGFKAEWSGEVEIIDATYEIVEGDTFIAEPADVTALLGTDELIAHQNELVAFKGMTVEAYDENGAAFAYKNEEQKTDDLYFKVSKDGVTYGFCVEFYLCGQDTDVYKAVEALNVGAVIDLEGFLYWYEGANPHTTAITVVTPAAPAAEAAAE